jgi:AraC-like DNA-binding protein
VDLRPGYRELAPPSGLGGAVACLWVRVVGAAAGEPTRVLPDACVDLIWQSGRGAWIAGPDTGSALAAPPPGSVLVGARFAPGAGGAALGLPLAELRDLRVPADQVVPGVAARLEPGVAPETALRRVAQFARERVAAGPPDRAVGAAAEALARPGARVDGLAARLGLSERQLRRRCHAAVGYGPKTLQRVLRLRTFLALAAEDRADLAGLALDAGYADQAHLTHECTRLAGLPPARLLAERASG